MIRVIVKHQSYTQIGDDLSIIIREMITSRAVVFFLTPSLCVCLILFLALFISRSPSLSLCLSDRYHFLSLLLWSLSLSAL